MDSLSISCDGKDSLGHQLYNYSFVAHNSSTCNGVLTLSSPQGTLSPNSFNVPMGGTIHISGILSVPVWVSPIKIYGNLLECGYVCQDSIISSLPVCDTISKLNLKALIEGFYNGTSMVPDMVRVKLHNATSPFELLETATVVLNSNGDAIANFSSASNATNYYLAIEHRNSIETWSKTAVAFSSGSLNYDFTTAADKAYGDNMKLKGTKWCIINGDCNQDDFIDASDYLEILNKWEASGPAMSGDTNGDQYIDGSDYLQVLNNWEVGTITPLSLTKKVSTKPISVGIEK